MEGYKTIKNSTSAEIEVKRSRFIATICPCENEQEAIAFVAEMKKKYWDARHNVYAYFIRENGLKRYSDDGEPHSTAGLPVLEVINHSGLTNIAVVVTRYFGGILLGTGGLVRAYSEAAKLAIEKAEVATVLPAQTFEILCDYSDYDPILKLCESFKIQILSTEFESNVKIKFAIPLSDFDKFALKIEDFFCARLKINKLEEVFQSF